MPMRARFTTLFNDLASADGAALFHCTAGKDRTGWTAAMLLSIAGVDEGTIMENYLATNDYTRQRVEATPAMLPAMAAIYEPLRASMPAIFRPGWMKSAASTDRWITI
ncbi:MAG: tyrosine-protein phosphatase [Enterobacteriaceae bacterium]